MAKKFFTDESLATFVDEIKSYTDDAVSTKANSSHNHSASNITSGTLSSDRLPTVPITKGGTGATTAAAALSNLGITATAAELNYVDGVTSSVQTQLNNKLGKTTYEYNKELALGSTGKVCIGKFPMYDSNISVEIKSTTSSPYNGTLIIATQNINTTGGGSYTAKVYGDADNSLTESIKIHYGSGSNVFSVYIDLPGWSKNLLHIQCVALKGEPTDIATTVSEIPSNATIVPVNALKAQLDNKAASGHTHNYAGSSSAGGSATSAVKLDTATAGSATQPVYFTGGKPTACTYTLGKSVPSDAVFTDTKYTHPTTSGNKHIPSGGSSGQILRWSADGTAVWGADNNTTYSVVSTTADGLAPKRDGSTTKFLRADGTWAVPPDTNTTYTLGSFGITATAAELNYTDGVTSNIQTQLNGKAPTSHASTATTYGIGTSSNYGHVKLSDSTSSTSAASSGIAASPKAVKSAYDLANTANTNANSAIAKLGGCYIAFEDEAGNPTTEPWIHWDA